MRLKFLFFLITTLVCSFARDLGKDEKDDDKDSYAPMWGYRKPLVTAEDARNIFRYGQKAFPNLFHTKKSFSFGNLAEFLSNYIKKNGNIYFWHGINCRCTYCQDLLENALKAFMDSKGDQLFETEKQINAEDLFINWEPVKTALISDINPFPYQYIKQQPLPNTQECPICPLYKEPSTTQRTSETTPPTQMTGLLTTSASTAGIATSTFSTRPTSTLSTAKTSLLSNSTRKQTTTSIFTSVPETSTSSIAFSTTAQAVTTSTEGTTTTTTSSTASIKVSSTPAITTATTTASTALPDTSLLLTSKVTTGTIPTTITDTTTATTSITKAKTTTSAALNPVNITGSTTAPPTALKTKITTTSTTPQSRTASTVLSAV